MKPMTCSLDLIRRAKEILDTNPVSSDQIWPHYFLGDVEAIVAMADRETLHRKMAKVAEEVINSHYECMAIGTSALHISHGADGLNVRHVPFYELKNGD